jgi:hypothetical protein
VVILALAACCYYQARRSIDLQLHNNTRSQRICLQHSCMFLSCLTLNRAQRWTCRLMILPSLSLTGLQLRMLCSTILARQLISSYVLGLHACTACSQASMAIASLLLPNRYPTNEQIVKPVVQRVLVSYCSTLLC